MDQMIKHYTKIEYVCDVSTIDVIGPASNLHNQLNDNIFTASIE